MAKTKISQYDATAANNTDIDSINIAEGMAPSNVNNAIRELMAHLKDMDAGTQALTSPQLTSADINGGTLDGVTIGGASAGAGTFTNLTATGTTTLAGASTSADITFGDNDKAIFGASSDLQIYHDGSDSFITDTGAGNLQIWGGNFRLRSSDGSEAVIDGNSGGAVTLYYNNAAKLATTSTGVDITGTLTSDGADVSGGADSTGQVVLSQGNTTSKVSRIIGTNQGGTNERGIDFNTYYYADYKRMNISPTGDISFYEDTGTTAKFFWDASAESLGIGTSSPEGDGLHIQASDNNNDDDLIALGFTFDANSRVLGTIGVHNSASNTGGLKFSTKNAGTLAERMRIDASGNLLVGKTTGALNTAGLELANTGYISASIDGDVAGYFNRKTSDGDIVQFYKDGAPVGSIGTNSSRLTIGNGDTGLLIAGDLDNITPFNTSTNASRDAAVDLGNSGVRFKDLYLSGGVYLGGTGSANKLDDYEEGTWTPTFAVGTNITYNSQSGTYTKIGRKVYVTGYMDVSNSDSDSSAIQIDLPFTGSSGSEAALFTLGRYFSFLGAKSTEVRACRFTGSRLVLQEDTGTNITYNEVASSGVFQFAAAYEVL